MFHENRYWDVEIHYAKRTPEEIHAHVIAYNSGPEEATLYLLPTLWFRNTWSWGDAGAVKPALRAVPPPKDARWAVEAKHPTLGIYYFYGRRPADSLFTENETNVQSLWGLANVTPYLKDAFHRYVIDAEKAAVNPALEGTKFTALHALTAGPGERARPSPWWTSTSPRSRSS